MAEMYQFTWDDVEVIELAIGLAKKFLGAADYSHIETKSFDLDTDKTGIRITIPHDPDLDEERKSV